MRSDFDRYRSVDLSFLIMCYNQETTIKDAIASALAQDFHALEIVISDDCSTDKTFEIAEKMASDYDGPHTIRLNRNSSNLGFVGHLNKCFDLCSADRIVYNPGDDISLPVRAQKLWEVFEAEDPLLIHSDFYELGRKRNYIGAIGSQQHYLRDLDLEEMSLSLGLCVGATCAWHKDVVRLFGPIQCQQTFDDLVFYFRASLADRVAHIPEPLICYRTEGGISNSSKGENFRARLKEEHKIAIRKVDTYRQRLIDCKTFAPHLSNLINELENGLEEAEQYLSVQENLARALFHCLRHPKKFRPVLSRVNYLRKIGRAPKVKQAKEVLGPMNPGLQ